MITRFFRFLLLLTLACVLPLSARAAQPSLAASVPDGAIGFVELSNLGDVVRSVRESSALKWVLATDEYRKYAESPEYRKAIAFKATAELVLGSSLWDLSANVLSGRIAVALYPDPDNYRKPHALAILRPDEPKNLERIREALKTLISASGKEIDTSALCPGSTTWSVKDQAYLSMHANWFVASQQRPVLERTLAILGGAKEKASPLSAQDTFAEMDRRLTADHHARAWVNTPLIRRAVGERFGLPQKATDGFGSLIFGGLLELAARSPFAGGSLDFHKNDVEGTLAIAGEPSKLPEPSSLWFTQYPENGVILLPNTPGNIAGVTIHRKVGQWYRQRESLLADHLLPAFDKFETDIGNLLPRKDFGQDVMPLLGDNFTFVSALQSYDHLGGQPGIKLPAFAGIFDLKKPKEGADTFQLFFQTLSAILNLQAGQEGRQPSVLDAEIYKDTKISFSRFLDKPVGDRLAIAYNFQPAAAAIGTKYIIATSVQYCRDLIDHFKNPASTQWQNRNSELILDVASLAKLAELNEGFLRSQDIQKGTTPDAAEKRVGLLISLLKQFNTLRYHSTADGGLFKMNLKVGWK
ncbi:MAG TPA: hypothetical protein VG796_25655 [Verrucomicrobiales bacterium]|nr:hypothetical protein [Verrucomicrobiales bacterium]